jgi:hypothetical protein
MKLRTPRHKRSITTLAILLAMLSATTRLPAQTAKGEYEVKAAFLLHFAQFVEWPPDSFKDATSPFTYCTIGDDPFHGALEQIVQGKNVGNRPLIVQHLKPRDDFAGCHILFIASEDKRRLAEALASAAGHPVLTVGESEHFARDGGIIGFLLENNKVRFDVNVQSAARGKLKISSRLLLLAKTVIGNEN